MQSVPTLTNQKPVITALNDYIFLDGNKTKAISSNSQSTIHDFVVVKANKLNVLPQMGNDNNIYVSVIGLSILIMSGMALVLTSKVNCKHN